MAMSQFSVTGFTAKYCFSTNTYILTDSIRKSAIIFDAPGSTDSIVKYLNKNDIERVDAVFLTHGHVDHIIAMNEYRAKLPGDWKAYLGEPDLPIWRNVNQQIEDFGLYYKINPIPDPEVLLKGVEEFTFGDTTIKCMLSPGHSLGSIIYHVQRKGEDDLLITGDVLFSESCGRTDWSNVPILDGTSSYTDLAHSIQNLTKYPRNITILPGHGSCSTLGYALDNVRYLL